MCCRLGEVKLEILPGVLFLRSFIPPPNVPLEFAHAAHEIESQVDKLLGSVGIGAGGGQLLQVFYSRIEMQERLDKVKDASSESVFFGIKVVFRDSTINGEEVCEDFHQRRGDLIGIGITISFQIQWWQSHS